MHELFAHLQRLWENCSAWKVVLFSITSLVISFGLLVITVVMWPEDRFTHSFTRRKMNHPVMMVLLIIIRNLIGWSIIALGIVLVIPGVPGQGVLTLVVGLTWIDLPGKGKLERKLVKLKAVWRGISWLRAKFKRAPLEV